MAELEAQKRELLGRKAKRLREDGLVLAELYGRGVGNVHLSIPIGVFNSVYKEAGEHSIVNVVIDKKESHPVLIHDVQMDPMTNSILSVDLYEVKMDEKVTTHVPINFEGESPAVRDLDGVLVKVMDELEVEALPANIPQSITVDLSSLVELNQSVYVRDLKTSDSYTITTDGGAVIVSVSEQREEEEEPVAELTPEDVIVEGEEKRAKEREEEEQSSGDEPNKEAKA